MLRTLTSRTLLPVLMGVFALVAGCGADDAEAEPSSPATVTVTAQPTTSPKPEAPEPSSPTTDETTATPAPPPATPTPAPVDLSAYDLPGFTTPSGNIGCLVRPLPRPPRPLRPAEDGRGPDPGAHRL